MRTNRYVHVHVGICACVYVPAQACMCVCARVYMCMCACVYCMHRHVCVHADGCMRVHVCTCVRHAGERVLRPVTGQNESGLETLSQQQGTGYLKGESPSGPLLSSASSSATRPCGQKQEGIHCRVSRVLRVER